MPGPGPPLLWWVKAKQSSYQLFSKWPLLTPPASSFQAPFYLETPIQHLRLRPDITSSKKPSSSWLQHMSVHSAQGETLNALPSPSHLLLPRLPSAVTW